MTVADRAAGRAWFIAAALVSTAFPVVFMEAARVLNWEAMHPVPVPGDDAPGGGDVGIAASVPLYAVLAILSCVFPLLWMITMMRNRKGLPVREQVAITMVLQGVALLLARSLVAGLPHQGDFGLALVVAEVAAVGMTVRLYWPQR